jgi:hypothetical protein
MAGSACFMPKLFPESLKIEDRKRLALLSNLGENMNHFLGDRSVLLVSPCLNFTIESVRHVFNIESGRVSSVLPPLWRNLPKGSSQRSKFLGGSFRRSYCLFEQRARDTSAMFSAIDRKVHSQIGSRARSNNLVSPGLMVTNKVMVL